VGVCFLIHPALGLLVIAGGVLLVLIALLNERAQRGALRESGEKAAVLAASHEAERQGAEAARALGFRGALIDRHLTARADMLDSQSTAAFSNAGYASVTKFVRILLQSATLGLGAYLAIQREVSPGAIIAATILASRAFAPLEQIVGAWRQIASADTAWKAVKTLLGSMPDKLERTPLPAPRGLVVLEDVAVKAPNAERLLIGEVSARLQPGEIVGVMGPSGAGKSTLARAIAGAVPAFYGIVRMDGASYADWEPEELARHIGYLPQDVQLFAGTVAENIARFQTGPEAAAKAVEAATKAGAHEMILRLPDGYNTPLGPLGRGLSFGQAQRIGLARALYGDPALLVLDEPNAHLDAEGEAALIGALKDAKARGATCVVVAHRPSTMSVADKVMIVREGRLDAFGPREQVVSKLTAVPAPPAPPGGPVSFAGAPL
jgi:ATP-binding cassette subfamily C protein